MDFIIIGNDKIGQVKAKLLTDKNPKTCKAIWDALPLEINLARWGEELYGKIPVKMDAENSQTECEVGDIGYWIDGKGFCIFFGKTPVSTKSEIRPASPVNIIGRLLGNPKDWKKVKDGEKITLDRRT